MPGASWLSVAFVPPTDFPELDVQNLLVGTSEKKNTKLGLLNYSGSSATTRSLQKWYSSLEDGKLVGRNVVTGGVLHTRSK